MQLARRRVGNGTTPHVPNADGLYGASYTVPGEPALRLTMLGDSTAAGQGVHRAGQTPGALLASGVAAIAERPVGLSTVAVPGARSDDLDRQVSRALADPSRVPDICVIMIGANDVTHRMPPTRSVRHLAAAVRRLRTAGGGGGRHVPGSRHDRAGTAAAALAGPPRLTAARGGADDRSGRAGRAHGVAGRPAGPRVRGEPAGAVRPGQLPPLGGGVRDGGDGGAADGVRGAGAVAGGGGAAGRGAPRGFLPVARAAAEAASEAGTEVTAAMPTGPRGAWALLKRRRRRRVTESEPEPSTQPSP